MGVYILYAWGKVYSIYGTIGGGREYNKFVPVLGGDGTKIARGHI